MPGYETIGTLANSLQKQAAVDDANRYLSAGNCSAALNSVSSFYSSSNTDNSIRMATASAYGCAARVNMFGLLTDLLAFPQSLGGPAFWEFLVQEFPSTASPDDKIPQAAKNGTDALMATLKPGAILISSYTVNSSSNNPGSLLTDDRLDDANSYLTFVSMSLMGSLLYRTGAPTSNNHKSKVLPWTTAANSVGDGCSFASALLNYYDGIQFVSTASTPTVASKYTAISSFLGSQLNTACSTGCTVICAAAVSCSTCPTTLRNRAACTGVNTDVNSCAAAGIAAFVNASWIGPP